MKNSLKQLLRTPARTALFLLLMTAATLLLVFSASLLSQTSQNIEEVENTFTTVATVEQPPISTSTVTWENECWGKYGLLQKSKKLWDVRVSVEDLLFEGADYVTAPEFRPYYMTERPEWEHTVEVNMLYDERLHILEFTALEDSDELGGAYVRVERSLLLQHDIGEDLGIPPPREGEEVFLCQCGGTYQDPEGSMIPLEKGKRYIATVYLERGCGYHNLPNDIGYEGNPWTTNLEYIIEKAPYSTQHDAAGNEIKSDHFPYLENGTQNIYRIEEVTEDFYAEGGRGQDWLLWSKTVNQHQRFFPVMPVSSLQMIPVFQEHRAYLTEGREITQEEYENGALVCLVPEDTLLKNGWKIGDKLSLPLLCSLYGPNAEMYTTPPGGNRTEAYFNVIYGFSPRSVFSPIKADGSEYEPFWTAEYEIVGTYGLLQSGNVYTNGEIYPDTILIPKNSVRASDADNIALYNYFDGKTATFQIENGTIDEFDAALRAAVPQAEGLIITYNDNGYTEIMESLQSTRAAAQLLFIVGLLAAVAIILLLLYFFIVKQKKRTAIERSLGLSKRQCRVSLLSGVLVLTILAAVLGTLGGAAAMEIANRQEQATVETTAEETDLEEASLSADYYNPTFSMWAKADKSNQEVDLTATTPVSVYVMIPLALVLLVFALSLSLVNRNLKTDPMLLLGGKNE